MDAMSSVDEEKEEEMLAMGEEGAIIRTEGGLTCRHQLHQKINPRLPGCDGEVAAARSQPIKTRGLVVLV